MKLKSKMLLWIGSPLIVIFIAMAAFSYWEASTMIEEATKREMRALSEYHAEEVNRMVAGPMGILEGVGRVWATNIPTDERFLEVAQDFTPRPDVDSIYMGFPKDTNRPFLYSEEGVVPLDQFDATSRPWYQRAESKEDVQVNDVDNLKWAMIVGLPLSLVVLSALLYKIAQSTAAPLENIAGAAQEVAKGNLAIQPPQRDRDDEIGQLHNSLLTMVKNLRELIQKTAQTSEHLAAASEQLTASADQSAQGAESAAEAIVKITGSTIEQNEVVDESFKTVDGITHAIAEGARRRRRQVGQSGGRTVRPHCRRCQRAHGEGRCHPEEH